MLASELKRMHRANNSELLVVQTYSDLGVIVRQDLKTVAHCCAAAAFKHVGDKTLF